MKIMSVRIHSFAGIQILSIKNNHRKYACQYIVNQMVHNLGGRLLTTLILMKQILKEMECIVNLD